MYKDDELLRLPSPTALVRGHELPLPGKLPDDHKGINAGVIVMTPGSDCGFSAMQSQFEQNSINGVSYGTAPEPPKLERITGTERLPCEAWSG